MSTYDNKPASETPDFTCPPGNRCSGCAGSTNLCKVTAAVADTPCCTGCSHIRAAGPTLLEMPLVWMGED